MKFIVQTLGVLSFLFFLLSNVNGQDVSISFDSLNYETINLQEDVEQQFALSSMFLSGTSDTISFRVTAISGTSIVEARINSLGDSLNLIPQENRFGQASVTISATNPDTDFSLEQQITVVVAPVDDAPIVNSENPLQDLGFDQFDVDTTLGLSLADRFIDVDEDVISITAEVENKSTGGSNFVDFDDASLTVTEDSLFISLLANTKHTFMVTLTATSNDTLSVSDTFDFVVDDAPTKNNTSISLDEDFGSVTYYLSGLFTDGDDTSTDFDLSFTDFLEGETIIENDTNSLILVRYYPEGDSIMLESKQNANGSYTLPITISSSERTVSEELVFEIAAVDDKPVVNNAIEDQLLPKNRSFRIELYELFRDIDNDIDFSNISISVDNPAPFEFKDQDENTLNLSSLTVNDSVVVVSVVGDPVGEKAIFTVNLDISTAFPSDDPVSDIFELEVSRAVINVYVSKEGDDANDWENGQALATIQKAIDVAQFGDTINIAAGTYIENISIKEGLIIRSELYEPTMTESQIESTVIKGEVNGGSVVNILRTDQVKLLGLKIQGSDGENTKETSTRNWEWVGDSSYDPSSMAWEGESFDNVPNDPNNRLYAIVIASEGSSNNRIESRNEWDWHNLYFEVAAGSDNTSFSGQSNFRYTIDGKDVYLTNNGYDLNGMRDFIQSTVPDGRMMVIESETQYDAMIADGQGYVAFGLINTEVVNGFGAGIYAQQSSFDLDKVIIENHQNTRSQWDNAAGILVFNSRKINVENSIIRNNTVQNGEASAIGVFWSDEFSLVNSIIQGNDVTGDNNCTASGFYAQGVQSVDIENAMFLDNEARCSHEIRISSVDNYTINHSLISKGINFQDVENRNGLVQNTIFLSGDMGNWGSTKPSKLKIRNNLINTGIWLDYEISSYGRNNILGGSANFEDAGAGNYRLKSTSTLIGAGISSSSTSDFDGNSRPSSGGSAPDIGPFENSLSKPELVFEPYTYVDATTSSDVQLRLETSVNWRNTYGLVEMVDLDQDGVDEIVFNEYLDNGVLKVISADGTQVTIHDEWDEYTVIKPMDINQDGYVDLVIANHSKIGYLYNDGNGIDASSFVEHTGFGVSTWDAEAIQWADLTSDGRVDAVLPEYSGIRIYDFEESAPTQQNLQLNNVDNQWLGDFGDAFVADINGDTRSDLILERRWYNKDAKDLLVFIQERNGFVYNEALSLIDVLEVPSNGDRSFDLQVISGDLDNDQLLDMIVTYEPSQAGGTGYLRRFELIEGSWNEVEAEIKLADESVVPFTDVFNVIINPKFVAVTEDDQLEIFAFVSDSRPENSDWERYYYPVLLELNDSSEFEVRQGYFSQELYRAHVNDAYQRPHLDFGFLNDDSSFDVVVTGRKESGKNSLVAFSNTYGFTPTEVPDPVIPSVTVRGSKLTVNLELETPYYNIKVCKDGNCNELVSSSGNGLDDKSAAIYTGAGSKEISYFLNPGSYNVSIQAIDQHLQTSNFVDSETVEVTGLIFQNGEKLFDDFFNSVNLINIDSDEEPEVYGFKKRFWYNGGERPSSLRVFNFGEVDTSQDYVLDNTGESPLISDFDLNGQADILVRTGDCGWPQKPYSTLFNIDENTSVDVFSESFVDLNIALDGGNCGAGITNNNLLIDIDQDGRDEVITAVVNEWDQEGLSIFAIESDDFDRNVVLRPSGEDVENWNGEDFDGFGALIKSRLDPSGRGHFIGLAHTYLDPDNDGDTDHLLAVNMQKGNPITALYFIETLGAGRVRAHYLNHFIDKSIIHLETVKDDDLTSRVIISVSDDTNYWLDAYSTRYVEFLNLDIANSDNLFEDMFDEAEAVSSENINPVNYKQNVNSALSYSEFEFEGIRLANLFETGDINNDGLTDVVVVGSNSYDTWNASAILNIYLQNEEGEFDPYISSISRGVKVFSFISSLNMIDMDGDAQFDVVVSGRLRFSNDGATIGFTNRTNTSEPVTLATPDQLSGQNNGYKVQLDWNDSNEGKLSYAVQIGTATDDYNISLGKLNQYGFPLFPDRFEAFHPSKSLTFDAYDLADRYYFRVKAIDQYGNTSDFSGISEVSLSQPFVLMDQSIPGLEEGGIAWGDYDRDGDLDLAIMGKEDGFTTAIFKNDSGTFVNTNQKLQKQSKGDLKWVDYDNDGFLDLIVVGLNPQLLPSLNIYKNVNGNAFVRQADSELPGLTDATLAFGDADADGDVDMVVAGIGEENGSIQYSFKLYTNRFNENSGRIFEMSPNFNYDGFVNGDIEFADLDNDGDLDIVYAGTGRGEQAVGGIIVNTRVGLSEQYNRYLYSNALSLKNASISVGDIDLDGDLDLITSGVSSNYNSVEQNVVNILYNNYYRIDSLRARINFREEVNTDITPLVDGDIDLTDFDNDGDLDILTSGADEFGNPQTLLYAQRSGDFFPVNAGFEHLSQSSVKWADFDTDGDMDVFISGKTGTISKTLLYENNTGSLVNVRPSSPSNLQVTDYGFGKIKLSWDKASDDYTSKSSLSYVIALGNESGQSTQFTTESNLETGYRLNPKPSSTLQNFMYLELDPGNYFFSVQAVDANYAGSEFSEEVAFGVTYIWKELNLGGIVDNSLPAGEDASVKFSDFDGDGDFDLAIFGKNQNQQFDLGLLENKGGSFEKIYDFEPITKGDFDWADINGDGTLDLFMTGENPWDETQVRANLYLNRTPIVDPGDSTFDGQFRWMDGRIFEEELITWQFQEPNDDQSFTAYGYLNGSYPPQIYDIGGDHTWYQGSALVESPVDYSVPNNGSWTWRNGQRIQDYVAWGDQYQPAVDPWASGAYAVVFSNGIFAEQAENGAQHPVILEIDEDASIAADVLNRISLIGNHDGIDYYGSNDYYSAPDIFENFNSYYSGFTMLTINTADEWNWVSENFGSMYGWIGLSVKYPIITNDNFTVYYQGNVGDKNYYRFDFYNGPQSALAIIDISFPGGSTLFIPDDQAELDVVLNRFGNHGLIGVVRKGFPSGTQRSLTNFQNSNLYFEPLVNAKVKFADIDNNGTPELIYAGSTSSTSIGRPALKIYKFLEDGFNITQREVQLSQELPNLTESSIEFGDLDRDQDIDIVLSGFDPFSGRRTIIFKNDGLDKSGRLILTEDFSSSPVGVQNGTIDLIDFDNDGDLDMVISGDSREGDVLQIYENQEGSFLELPASLGGLEAMKNGRTSWGDFNGDGFADILYSGEVVGKGDFTGLAIYDQSSAAFLQDNFDLSQFANAAVAFGDYDADDDLDMVLTGENKYFDEFDPGSQKYISKLYVNVRNESAKLNPGAPTNQAQGDYSAMTTSNLFTSQVNQPPSIPVLSEVETLVDSTSSGLSFVQLNWSPSVDDFTASAGLTYSLRIGSSPGSNDILDAQANADGSRRVSGKGNVEHNTSWKISLPTGSYYWSVQALDASYSASSFSEEETFLVTESGSVDINVAPIAVDTAFTLRIEEEVGHNVGAVNVSDANGDELLFSILSGNEAGVFSIGQTTGVIFLADKTNLDTALTTQFILDILVSDGALSDTAVVTIDILAENNAPVANSLDFEITADAAYGTVVGQVEATDPDGDAVSYSIVSGNEQGIFEIAESSGEITIVKPDLLEARTYVLGVEVSDGLAATTIDITIEVRSLLGIEDMLANVAVYPIPTSERLTVQLYQLRNVEITLLDLSGREIMLRQVEAGNTELDVSHLRKGIYLLKLSLMEQDLEYVRKIVIE